MKVTNEGDSAPAILLGSVGGDPALPDGAPPTQSCCDVVTTTVPDRAASSNGGYAVALSSSGAPTLVQSAEGFYGSDPVLGATATAGNLLVFAVYDRNPAPDPGTPTGFTSRGLADNDATGFKRAVRVSTKVSNGSETTALFSHAGERGVLMEWTGSYDAAVSQSDIAATTSIDCGGSLTPTSGVAAAIIGAAVIGNSDSGSPSVSPNGGATELFDLFDAGFSPLMWLAYRDIATTSGGYTVNGTCTDSLGYGGVTISIVAGTAAWTLPEPATIDGNDATYSTITGADVLRVDLGASLRIIRTRLRIGTATAGSRTYTIKAANNADFSDEVTITTLSFTATGSYTAQDVTATWYTDTAYRYWELSGDNESRRIYSWELYEGTLATNHEHSQYVLSSVLTTRGDLFRRGASAVERVGLGTSGYVLTSNGTDAVWAVAGSGSTASNSLAINGVTVTGSAASNYHILASSPTAAAWVPDSGGGAVSAGSNSTRVREVSTAGASTTLWSPFDHAHDGIGTITASSSNTMQRGTWNIRPGAGIALSLTDTDGDGEFDTTTIVATGAGGGGGGSLSAVGAIIRGQGANNCAALMAHLPPDSGVAPTLVQETTPTSYSGGSGPTLGSTPVVGNLIVAYYFSNQYKLNAGSGISQTNVTWTRVASAAHEGGAYVVAEIWYGVVGGSPGSTITISPTSNNVQGVYVQEWSGVGGGNLVDATAFVTSYTMAPGSGQADALPINMGTTYPGGIGLVWAQTTGGTLLTPAGWTHVSGFSPGTYMAATVDMT